MSLFLIWLPSGVSWSLSFVTDHLSVQCTWANFLKTTRLVPNIFVKIGPTACVLTILSDLPARSQKFAMGGAVLGVWGRSSQPPEANGGLGAKQRAKPPAAGGTGAWGRSPSARKFWAFFAKITKFQGYFDKKIMLLKRGLEIGSANMIKLVA